MRLRITLLFFPSLQCSDCNVLLLSIHPSHSSHSYLNIFKDLIAEPPNSSVLSLTLRSSDCRSALSQTPPSIMRIQNLSEVKPKSILAEAEHSRLFQIRSSKSDRAIHRLLVNLLRQWLIQAGQHTHSRRRLAIQGPCPSSWPPDIRE